MTKIIQPAPLTGAISIPPSKSLSHRAVLAAALAEGESVIENLIFSEDIEATTEAIRSLGVQAIRQGNTLTIRREGKLKAPTQPLFCNESGSTLRFLIPFAGLFDQPVTFTGAGKLTTRPLNPYFDLFDRQGIHYDYPGQLPLTVHGRLKPGRFEMPGHISSQFVTGLLYVLPLLDGDSEILLTSPLESRDYVTLTLQILEIFGIEVETLSTEHYKIRGNQVFKPARYKVEGDYSQAAFWIAGGLIGNGLVLKDLAQQSQQGDQRILQIVSDMGGKLDWREDQLMVSRSTTHGTVIDASQCPDLVPICATLAALSEGTTHIINAGRVRLKESDRLTAICTELNKLGANIQEEPEGLVIQGVGQLSGGDVEGWNDHRIVMSLAMASIKCTDQVRISGSGAVKKSYPHFFEDFEALGGQVTDQ
jgi:3-phosphoshikimate 1-carboxyvinyltransferase